MSTWLFILTLLAALGSGMMAGLFFIFSTCIMQALAKRPAPVGIAAMQSINETILSPIFFLLFFGTAVVGVALVVLVLLNSNHAGAGWLLAGDLLYLICSIGITMRFNVPLNNQLMKVTPDSVEGATFWAQFLKAWLPWNHVRTVGCIAATVCFMLGLF